MYKRQVPMSRLFAPFLLACALLPPVLQAEVLEDPMRPPTTIQRLNPSAKSPSGYHLSSIFISSTRRTAIINDKHVAVGDRVGNARVIEIQATEVKINLAGKTRTLTLLPLSIKKPAEAPQP